MRNRHFQVRIVKDNEQAAGDEPQTIDYNELAKTVISETTDAIGALIIVWHGTKLVCRLTEHIVVTKVR